MAHCLIQKLMSAVMDNTTALTPVSIHQAPITVNVPKALNWLKIWLLAKVEFNLPSPIAIAGYLIAAIASNILCISLSSDINECERSACSQGCVNTIGSFQCLCPSGYQNKSLNLNETMFTCEGYIQLYSMLY